jgi:hypothetical protein
MKGTFRNRNPVGIRRAHGAYRLAVALPRLLSAIGTRHRIIDQADWRLFIPIMRPPPRSAFAELTEQEVTRIEGLYAEAFGD